MRRQALLAFTALLASIHLSAATLRPVKTSTSLARRINHNLGAIQACCELAKMKGESGADLERRMDDVIEIVAETSALVRRLAADCRRRRNAL